MHRLRTLRYRRFCRILNERAFLFPCRCGRIQVRFAYGYVLNELDGRKVYYLHAIDVMEGWRNQGYGTELVRFVHEHSKTLGCRKMFLLTNKRNASACRCYGKAGGICNAASDDIVFAFR